MASVLIPLAQGCEELEAITIIDLLRRAEISVETASLDEQPVTASRGTRLVADTTIDEALNKEYDMVVLPGGLPGADNLNEDPRIHQILKSIARQNKPIGAICAAPLLLLDADVISPDTTCTAHGSTSNELTNLHPSQAVIQEGKIITSRGAGTAVEFGLSLIERLFYKFAT